MSNKEVVQSRVLSVHQCKVVTGGGGGDCGGGGGANATGEASGDISGDTSGEEGDAPLRPASEYKVIAHSGGSYSVPQALAMT